MAGLNGNRKKVKKTFNVIKPRLLKNGEIETVDAEKGFISWTYWIFSLTSYVTVLLIIYNVAKSLPIPTNQRSVSNAYQFRESKARQYLSNLTSYGAHMVGSVQNEYYIPLFIVDTLKTIEDKSRGINDLIIDNERVTGSYFANYAGGFVNYYENVNTIIAKFGSKDVKAPSVLVSCNYDSSSSPGISYFLHYCMLII